MRLSISIALTVAAAGFISPSAHAASIFVANPSFETPATTTAALAASWNKLDPTNNNDAYNPYEFTGNNIWYNGANSTTDPANGGAGYPGILGENLAVAYQSAPGGGLTQTLGATLAANTRYTLLVEEGARNGTLAGGFLGSTIELLAGSTVIASATDTVGPTPGIFRDQVALLANSSAFPALVGQALTIELLTTNVPTSQAATDWDNVRLDGTAVVPEPATTTLLLSGALAMAGFGLIRRRATAARRR